MVTPSYIYSSMIFSSPLSRARMWTFSAMVNYSSVDCLQTIKCNVNGCHPWLRIIPTVLTFRHLCRVVLDPGLQLGDGFQVSWRRCLHSICLCPAQLWNRVNRFMEELFKFEETFFSILLAELNMPLESIITELSTTVLTRLGISSLMCTNWNST